MSVEVSHEKKPLVVPRVQDYEDYRAYMNEMYVYKKSLRAGFTHRRFSQLVGLKSHNYLHLVMKGERNLSNDLAKDVARALGLKAAEAAFFEALVHSANAETPEQKDKALREKHIALKKLVTKEIPAQKSLIFQKWYYLVIRELVFLEDFDPRGEWISLRLRGLVSVDEAETALDVLVKSGFLKTDSATGRLQASEPVIDSGEKIDSATLLAGHIDVFRNWLRVLPLLSATERELGYLNLTLSKDKMPELKERIRRFQDELIGWAESEKNPDTVIQVGTYAVPVSRS